MEDARLAASIPRSVDVIAVGLMLPLAFSYGVSRNRTTSKPATTIVVTAIISACTTARSAGSA